MGKNALIEGTRQNARRAYWAALLGHAYKAHAQARRHAPQPRNLRRTPHRTHSTAIVFRMRKVSETMADENVSFGWTGKIARVNLTTGAISSEPTEPYKQYIGGMGLANKIMYDEVPEGTDPLSPESKIVMAVGPLTASGVPLAGRTTFSHLSTFTTDHLVVDSHCGGMIGAKLKLAGWDALVIEGAAESPVYIRIENSAISIEDASDVWGLGTRATTEALCRKNGNSFCVAAIGQAGENQPALRMPHQFAQPFRRRRPGHHHGFQNVQGAGYRRYRFRIRERPRSSGGTFRLYAA